MSASGNVILEDLHRFVRSLNREEADILIAHLPTVIAILEGQSEPSLQKQFLQTG
jgi:hypothetical protein